MSCIIAASATTPVPLGKVMNERTGNMIAEPANPQQTFALGLMGSGQEVKNLNNLVDQDATRARASEIIDQVMGRKTTSSIEPYDTGYAGSMPTPAQAQLAAQQLGSPMMSATDYYGF